MLDSAQYSFFTCKEARHKGNYYFAHGPQATKLQSQDLDLSFLGPESALNYHTTKKNQQVGTEEG
jgi:hypothetical protein